MNTKEVIADMLTERVGTSILDSGGTPRYDEDGNYAGSSGGYGRHFERNRDRQFEVEDRAAVEFWARNGELDVVYSKNVFHFLVERLEFDEEWDEFFLEWANERDSHWLDDMDAFPEYLEGLGFEVSGLYGDGEPFVVNTYNHESAVSQILQFLYMTVETVPEEYEEKLDWGTVILLQIHGGADARGGYTAPRAFFEVEEVGMLMDNDGLLGCENGHTWYTDDSGYHWYANNSSYKDLKKYQAYEVDDLDLLEEFETWREENGYNDIEPIPEEQLSYLPDGERRRKEINEVACLDVKQYIALEKEGIAVEDHRAFCPLCGEVLMAEAY